MKKFAIVFLALALLGGLVGASTAQATSTPTATLDAQQGMGLLTVYADPLSQFTVWDTAWNGTQYSMYYGQVGPSGTSSAMIPLSHYGSVLTVVVSGPGGAPPVSLTVVKDDRWIWD